MCLRFLIIFLEPKWPLSSLEKTLFWEDKPPAKQGRALWETSPPGSNLSGELQSQSVRGQGLKRKHVIYIDIYINSIQMWCFQSILKKGEGGGTNTIITISVKMLPVPHNHSKFETHLLLLRSWNQATKVNKLWPFCGWSWCEGVFCAWFEKKTKGFKLNNKKQQKCPKGRYIMCIYNIW